MDEASGSLEYSVTTSYDDDQGFKVTKVRFFSLLGKTIQWRLKKLSDLNQAGKPLTLTTNFRFNFC